MRDLVSSGVLDFLLGKTWVNIHQLLKVILPFLN